LKVLYTNSQQPSSIYLLLSASSAPPQRLLSLSILSLLHPKMTEEEGKELSQLKTLRAELSIAKKKVLALQQEIREVEEQIYSKCKHEWKIDYTNVGEHTEHICTNCGGFRPPTTGFDNPTA